MFLIIMVIKIRCARDDINFSGLQGSVYGYEKKEKEMSR